MSSLQKRTRTRKGAPGIVEVATRAGVSPATVSRFFNNPDVVRGPTKKRIEKAASDLGYIRDRMAGAMHNRMSGSIGLIVPTIDNAIFSELIQAFSEELRAHDRTMLIAAHNYDLTQEVSIVRSLLERRIDGVALVGFRHEDVPLEMLATRNIPTLAIWNYSDASPLSCVGADNREAGELVAEHMIQQGHKDVAFLFSESASNDRAKDRLEGALHAFGRTLSDLPENRFVQTKYDIGDAKQSVLNLLETSAPTALICGNDVIARGAIYACQKRGLRIPQDISIVGIGDFRGSQHMEPALTTVRLPARRIGTEAARLICTDVNLENPAYRIRKKLPIELVERGSVAPL